MTWQFFVLTIYVIVNVVTPMKECPDDKLPDVEFKYKIQDPNLKNVDHVYYRDKELRVVRMCAKVKQVFTGNRTGIGSLFNSIKNYEHGTEYDVGHLLPHMYGGTYDDLNVFPQKKSVNRGEWAKFEKLGTTHLSPGEHFYYSVRLIYSPEEDKANAMKVFAHPHKIIGTIYKENKNLLHQLEVAN